MYRSIVAVVAALALAGTPVAAKVTVGEILNPLDDYLECDTTDPAKAALCLYVRTAVNSALADAGLSVVNGNLLFSYYDGTDEKISTGHSCSTTAKVTSKEAKVVLKSTASIDLRGDILSEPAMFVVDLPIDLSARINAKARYGHRVLGSCSNTGSDSFYASGAVSMRAQLGVFLSLETKWGYDPVRGNYVVSIQPIVDVSASFDVSKLKMAVHGLNPFTGVWTAVAGGTSTMFDIAEDALKGDSISSHLKQLGLDIAGGTALTMLGLAGRQHIMSFASDWALKIAQEDAGAAADELEQELENKIAGKVSAALGLNAQGARAWAFGVSDLKPKSVPALPSAVTTMTVVQGCHGVPGSMSKVTKLSWSASSGATVYEVQRSTDNVTVYKTAALRETLATFSIATKFRVRACSVYGCSAYSAWASAPSSRACNFSPRPVCPTCEIP